MLTRRLSPPLWTGLMALGIVALLSPAAIAQVPERQSEQRDSSPLSPLILSDSDGASGFEAASEPDNPTAGEDSVAPDAASPAAEITAETGSAAPDPAATESDDAGSARDATASDRAEGPNTIEGDASPPDFLPREDQAVGESTLEESTNPDAGTADVARDAEAAGDEGPGESVPVEATVSGRDQPQGDAPVDGGAGDSVTVPSDQTAADSPEVTPTDATSTDTAATEAVPTETEGAVESAGDPSSDTEETSEATEEATDAIEAERQRRLALFAEGDRLFRAGRYAEAEGFYRQAKAPLAGSTGDEVADEAENGDASEVSPVGSVGSDGAEDEAIARAEPVTDPTQLPLGAQGHWRRYHEGLEMGLDSRIDVPLQLLTQDYPQFIPAHIKYAERLYKKEQPEEALAVLERAVSLYPDHPLLVQAHIEALVTEEEWLQAAIAARQFALINPEHPAASELSVVADEYQSRFRRRMRSRITRRAIGNVLAGGVGFALTGNLFGPLSALQTSILLMRGETAVGERAAAQAVEQLEIITDAEVVNYVNELGQELAVLGGRSEFDYEFYVVAEDELNAFALPGGKIFINAGAILSTETQAELAGLVAHELAHAVLSHGFQMMTGGNLVANMLQVVPYGGVATNLAVLNYSRSMENQADRLGTRMLAVSPYAADGMARLMATLETEGSRAPFAWLSTHPDTGKRTRRLNTLIEENGYNRYAYEGVVEHQEIQARVRQILIQAGVLLELDESEAAETEASTETETEADNADTTSDPIEADPTGPIDPEAEATPSPAPASAAP